MSKLTSRTRNKLSDGDFALPGRRYPIHDENHARAALTDVSKVGTDDEKAKVRAAVRRRYPGIKVEGDKKPKPKGKEYGVGYASRSVGY